MGYPMTWWRLVHRNGLEGDYSPTNEIYPHHHGSRMIAGDMRRLEEDSRDEHHLSWVADCAGITPDQAKIVLDWFFRDSTKPFPEPKPEFFRQQDLPEHID